MGKLSSITVKEALKVFEKLGFEKISQRGSHIKMRRDISNKVETIIVPNHKILKEGTLKNGILKPVGITPEQFIKLLR
jgi:predicted RNA binding protein YcfA (HicA-like mRNA interferase family)